MAEQIDELLDLEEIDSSIEKRNKVEERIKDLSDKVRTASNERDEAKKISQEKDLAISNLEKEKDFLDSFGSAVAKNPIAAQFKDKIKEKVLKGYSVEDATVSTLISEGKYNSSAIPVQVEPPENPAGGPAASTQPTVGGDKSISGLSRDEKRAKLLEAEKRGDISLS